MTDTKAGPAWSPASPPGRRLRMAVVGCGDVAFRRYLPALATAAEEVEIVALCDPRSGAAEAARAAIAAWSPNAHAFVNLQEAVRTAAPDAVINLTPAPIHGSVSQHCLDAGAHVYSEKPLAATLEEADRLIDTAERRGLLLLCAPAVAATRRFAWLREIVSSQEYGALSLVVSQFVDPGPAAWREYTGNPIPFYGPEVGPLRDHGVYRLHAMTSLCGPVARVQAMGAIGLPDRIVKAGPLTGQRFPVTAPDHLLINLEFASGALGQLLSSFGGHATLAPWLELHFTRGTLSFDGDQYDKDSTASLYLDDERPEGQEEWVHGLGPPPPGEPLDVVETGVAHFLECLRGQATPILTAQHARHVLDVIVKVYASVADGASHATETVF